MKRRIMLSLATAMTVGVALVAHASGAQAGPGTYNVRNYGATGNGSTLDDDAIDAAINAAASGGGGGTVLFPSGTYRSRTIHLKSNITLQLDSGATIVAHSSGLDAAEPNQWDDYQDFGHSHFHNSLMWGDNITNFHITGNGTIDGGGNMITSNSVPNGRGDKLLSLTRCSNVSLRGITMRRGGHFMAIINGCAGVTIDNVKTIWTEEGVRDGINMISTRDVVITNSRIEGSDDALAFKSDYALGRRYVSENIRVSDTVVYSHENNALQFGSETCGHFRDIRFDRITILGAGKAGIGMVSMDGAIIEDVHYKDITITRSASAVFMKIGDRSRCPDDPPAGRIRNITLTNVSGSNLIAPDEPGGGGDREYASTITGTPSVDVENVTLTNVDFDYPGGHPASDASRNPGEYLTTYPPRDYGVRPAYGWWMRHVRGITFNDSDTSFASNDGRPAFIVDDAANIAINRTRAERGSSSAYDVGFRGTNGYCVRDSTNTSGGALRINASGSSQNCMTEPPPPPPGRYEAETSPAVCDGTIDSNHVGFSGTGFCNATNAVGGYAQWTVNAAAAGPATLKIGYANGTTSDRPASVAVNGTVVATPAFGPTGAWTTWAQAAVPVTLNAGSNTIRVAGTTALGPANLDYLDVVAGGGTGPSSYEAEASGNTRNGSVAVTSCSTCSGGSKVRFIGGNTSNWLTVNGVVASSAGTHQLRVYGTVSGTRTFFVSVNGGAAQQVSLTGTDWVTPVSAVVNVSLNAGTNSIRFFNDSANAPDLDRITIS